MNHRQPDSTIQEEARAAISGLLNPASAEPFLALLRIERLLIELIDRLPAEEQPEPKPKPRTIRRRKGE